MQYYTTLAAQQRTATWETLVNIATRSYEVAEKLLKAGEGTRSDSLLFAIEVDRAEVGLANTQTTLTIGRRQLAILVGMPDLEFARLTGELNAELPDYDEAILRDDIARANPAANIARVEIDRQALKLQRANVEPIPNINVMGGYQRQVAGDYQNMGLFQVSVVVPLWNRNQGNRFAAQSQLAGARADVQRIELELANQAAQSLTTYRTASQLVAKYESHILPKARDTFRISEQLYAQGQIDFLRLLQAQKTLLEAELARIDALEQRWRAAAMIAGLRQDEQFP
jgi:cobalt-zinc-cadmium efflux system outer membrane protein